MPVQQGTDLGYISKLAAEAGYVFYLVPGPLPGMSQAYFGPQVRVGVPQPALYGEHGRLDQRGEPDLQLPARRAAVAPIVYMPDRTTGVPPIPVPIPPVTPFNPPLGAIVPAAPARPPAARHRQALARPRR